MPVLLNYILKLSVCLIVIWIFYQLVLRRLTFYTWNRWYLVVCPALAFLLPLVNISAMLENNKWIDDSIVSAIPSLPNYTNIAPVQKEIIHTSASEQFLQILPWLLAAGAIAMFFRLLVQFLSLLSMRRSSKLILNGPVKVYQVDKPVIPFSFGKSIFINQHLHAEEELKEIIRHEFIHVKQRHTIDIIWGELICILSWYNPFVWLLRKAIRQNLEFIADQQVLKTGFDRRQYQYLLLKVIGTPSFSIASNFNFKSLKKRIAMMNKVKSARLNLVRFLLLLPLIAVILVAFRNAANLREEPTRAKAIADTIAPGKSGLPPNVRSMRTIDNKVTVTLKDGKEENFDLDNEKQRTSLERKYGRMPEPPAAPAPAPTPATFVAEPVPAPHVTSQPTPAEAPVFVAAPDAAPNGEWPALYGDRKSVV